MSVSSAAHKLRLLVHSTHTEAILINSWLIIFHLTFH